MRLFRAALLLLLIIAGWLLVRRAYVLRGDAEISDAQLELLRQEGLAAIPSGDVPIGAILLYGDHVIGRGHNTQVATGDAAGHAEVNAVSDALRAMGRDAFNALNRDSLLLVSTFEPCAMCRGMMEEHRIECMAFLKPKSLRNRMKSDARLLQMELTRRTTGHERLQDSLFRAHPAYDARTADH
ncbi:MAG: hypothetical protein H6591_06440 [Flavobacteriales bacterium]|nr:hypothetical protein [Flavobacteriales bacterium]